MLSIIIPALNEEKSLPRLLQSIKNQNLNNYEVIVADAGSEDGTREIAREFGCKVVQGGKLARGRNNGAMVAQGDLLLFCDADLAFEKGALKKYLREFQRRNLDIATFFMQPFGKSFFKRLLYDLFRNYPCWLLERVLPNGGPILVRKRLHQKIGGFDETIMVSEDTIYVRKAAKYGKFRYLKYPKIYWSQRRFEKEGWVKTYLKYLFAELCMLFGKPIRTNILKYKYNRYSKKR